MTCTSILAQTTTVKDKKSISCIRGHRLKSIHRNVHSRDSWRLSNVTHVIWFISSSFHPLLSLISILPGLGQNPLLNCATLAKSKERSLGWGSEAGYALVILQFGGAQSGSVKPQLWPVRIVAVTNWGNVPHIDTGRLRFADGKKSHAILGNASWSNGGAFYGALQPLLVPSRSDIGFQRPYFKLAIIFLVEAPHVDCAI
mmetsp:Transcript_5981/g.18012  ORF Transcript_5981/g.18012 Transcript_5981/m.18012 type:complete len:200 (-) Transcript_5981:341-940(-)